MAEQNTFHRSRQSMADIERELHAIFSGHPNSYTNSDGEPMLPVRYFPDVFATYRQSCNVELLDSSEIEKLEALIEASPGLEAGPQALIDFVAQRTVHSPQEPDRDAESPHEYSDHEPDSPPDDGRRSRASSVGSNGTVYQPSSRPPSRPPSRGPSVPPKTPGPFDGQKRQRSTPLGAAPSSWTRPVAPGRRKSDASQHGRSASASDSEQTYGRRPPSRSRAPSNPQTPSQTSLVSPDSSFVISPPSRPHSRAQSQPFNRISPQGRGRSPAQLDLSNATYEQFEGALPMPRFDDGSDDGSASSEEDESALGLVMDRSAASSTASMEPQERSEALGRVNTELRRKLMEAERTLQAKMAEHEAELEEMQGRLEETRAELAVTRREEKELRGKERTTLQQIAVLEQEVARVQKSLEASRASYQALQRQYAEQLSQSEDLRNTLRRKDREIKEAQDAVSLSQLEGLKWGKEHDAFMDRIHQLEQELSSAQQTHASLDEQKHENLMLKETIDRMRFDMDELRGMLGGSKEASGSDSRMGSVSRSLGAELARGMKEQWEEEEVEKNNVLSELGIEDEDTEGEDVVQTIITRTKRRGLGRANQLERSFTVEESKEYSDAYTQYDAPMFQASSQTQTDPEPAPPVIIRASFALQTDPEPVTPTATMETQTEEWPEPRHLVEMEIQTDAPEPEEEESQPSSSSSTAQPSTPRAAPATLEPTTPTDLPPSYTQVTGQPLFHEIDQLLNATDLTFAHVSDPTARRELQVAAETLQRLHKGLHLPAIRKDQSSSVSNEAVAEWRALKEELGVDCTVIDRLVESAQRKDSTPNRRRSSRFFNIYNTYVYGAGASGSAPAAWPAAGLGTQVLLCIGASAAVFLAMSPFLAHHYVVPGGPTYYDRAAWSSFNSMHAAGEGFTGEGTAAVWSLFSRVGFGAARVVRGWPT